MRVSVSVLVLGAILLSGSAWAATFTVGNAADIKDALPGDGKCSFILNHPIPNDPSVCTLRAAIMEANADAVHDIIVLADGVTYLLTIPGRDEDNAATGDLDIRQPVTIGPPTSLGIPAGTATINANGLDRAFDIWSSGVTTLVGLKIRDGDPGNGEAGGIEIVGSKVQLYFLDVATIKGDGIYAFNQPADVTIGYSTVSGAEDQSAVAAQHFANIAVNASSLIGSVAGLFVRNAYATVDNSTISGQTSSGISVISSSDLDAQVEIAYSTIADVDGYALNASGAAATVSVIGTLFASNAFGSCFAGGNAVFDMTGNLYDDEKCPYGGATDGSLFNTPAFLSLLGDHGGVTPTHRPMTNSPALDRIMGASCSADTADQRLMPRAVAFKGGQAACDIGSVEVETDVIFFDQVDRL